MNKFHQEIISLIKKYSTLEPDKEGFGLKYVGTDKASYHLNTKDTQQVAKDFLKYHNLILPEFHELIISLYQGKTYDEINIGAKIVQYSKQNTADIDLKILDTCLDYVHGWAEVDTLCQMAFYPPDIIARWGDWKKFLLQLNKDENVHKRRASLVILTKVVGKTDNKDAADLAFKNISSLKHEKDILITKSISWLLRCLIQNHRQELEKYLKENMDTLPKIAVREVTSKLNTGKKYINKKKLK